MIVAGESGNSAELITMTRDGEKKRLDVSMGLATMPGFNIPPFDAYYIVHTTAYIDTITYKMAGVTVAVVTATYADTTKVDLISAVKT